MKILEHLQKTLQSGNKARLQTSQGLCDEGGVQYSSHGPIELY
jgi:hypothetical protein